MQRFADDAHSIARLLHELEFEKRKAEEMYLTHRNNYWITRNKFWLLCGVAVCFGLLLGCAVLLVIGPEVRLSNPVPLLMIMLVLVIFALLFIVERGEKRVIRKFRRRYESQYALLHMLKKAP